MATKQILSYARRLPSRDLLYLRAAINGILEDRRNGVRSKPRSKARKEYETKHHRCELPTGRTAHYTHVWERTYDSKGQLQQSRLVESRIDRIEGRLP